MIKLNITAFIMIIISIGIFFSNSKNKFLTENLTNNFESPKKSNNLLPRKQKELYSPLKNEIFLPIFTEETSQEEGYPKLKLEKKEKAKEKQISEKLRKEEIPDKFKTAAEVVNVMYPGVKQISPKLYDNLKHFIPGVQIRFINPELSEEQKLEIEIIKVELFAKLDALPGITRTPEESKRRIKQSYKIMNEVLPKFMNVLSKEQRIELAKIVDKKIIQPFKNLSPNEKHVFGY